MTCYYKYKLAFRQENSVNLQLTWCIGYINRLCFSLHLHKTFPSWQIFITMCKYDSGKEFEHLIMMHLLCVQFLFVICYIWYLLPIYLYKTSYARFVVTSPTTWVVSAFAKEVAVSGFRALLRALACLVCCLVDVFWALQYSVLS